MPHRGCRGSPRSALRGPPRPPGQDHRDPPQLRLARRSARAAAAASVVLLQAVELGRGIRRHHRAPRRHRAARLRGRDRARHRHRRAARARSPTRGTTSRWVTAANDFGLYDLRANDKGSNVRSKGGDGFTPIGPALIDARAVDPAALRAAHLGQRRARAGRHDRGPALPARAARRRSVAALHARAGRRDPHRHAGRLVGRRARRRRRGRGRRPGRADLRPARHDGRRRATEPFDPDARLAPRRRRPAARRGVGLARGRRAARRESPAR